MLPKYNGEGFDSPERKYKTTGRRRTYTKVEPDSVSTPVVIDYAPFGYGPPILIPYPESAFWDAKSIREGKSISISKDDYQHQGFLDYLSHYSSAARAPVPKNEHPFGHLIYMTTSDVGVTKGVLEYTGEPFGSGVPISPYFTPVIVYQMVACLKNTNGDYTKDYLQMGRGIPLNGNRFSGYPKILYKNLAAGRPSSLKF